MRTEKDKELDDLAAREKLTVEKLAVLTAAHDQAVAKLQQELDETGRSLEQVRSEKSRS